MAENDEQRLDDLLDSALSAYSAAEPRPGLEARVLARIQESAEQPAARWWQVRWLVAATAVAGVSVLVLSLLFPRQTQTPPRIQVERPKPVILQPQPENSSTATKLVPHKERHVHRNAAQQELAIHDRPAVFPTPGPLSEQEKLMLAYVARTPKEELVAQNKGPDLEEEEFWKNRQPATSRSQR